MGKLKKTSKSSQVLELLAKKDQPTSISQIGRELGWAQGTTSTIVNDLFDRGKLIFIKVGNAKVPQLVKKVTK